MLYKKAVLKIFVTFSGKHMRQSLYLKLIVIVYENSDLEENREGF